MSLKTLPAWTERDRGGMKSRKAVRLWGSRGRKWDEEQLSNNHVLLVKEKEERTKGRASGKG